MADRPRDLTVAFRYRGAFRGPNAAVAANHPLAAQAGLRVLHEGGTAADAAVAMAAVMVVVQPQYSHLGGDVFALTYEAASGRVDALNSSGPAPSSANLEEYRSGGAIPAAGARSVTTPGCVDGWWKLHQRFGRLPWGRLLEDAIAYAAGGFPASRSLAAFVASSTKVAPRDYFERTFGHVERGGESVRQPDLALTLTAIAADGSPAFYTGEIAEACRRTLAEGGAPFTADDWQGPARWEQPLSAPFAGTTLYTQPPPSHGFVLPLAGVLYEQLVAAGTGLGAPVLQYTALVQAFALRDELAGDPDHCGFDARELLVRALKSDLPNLATAGPTPRDGDTTYLFAIDPEGNAVSLIQSIFDGWGSGLFVPGTGILLNNRLCGFSLREGHPNALAPRKRPMHTLHSYIATDAAGRLRAVGGTPGAMQQPQTNLQVLDAVLRHGADPQDALDAPRWAIGGTQMVLDNAYVMVEAHTPDQLSPAFQDAGIEARSVAPWSFGRAFLALVDDAGIAVAADLRGEGVALVV